MYITYTPLILLFPSEILQKPDNHLVLLLLGLESHSSLLFPKEIYIFSYTIIVQYNLMIPWSNFNKLHVFKCITRKLDVNQIFWYCGLHGILTNNPFFTFLVTCAPVY